jgi:hypothetical protein
MIPTDVNIIGVLELLDGKQFVNYTDGYFSRSFMNLAQFAESDFAKAKDPERYFRWYFEDSELRFCPLDRFRVEVERFIYSRGENIVLNNVFLYQRNEHCFYYGNFKNNKPLEKFKGLKYNG